MQVDTLRVAAIQLNSQADLSANLRACRRQVVRAAEQGAKLIVLPENFAYLGPESQKSSVAERLGDFDAPIQSELQSLARDTGSVLVAGGFPERSSDPNRPYNTCLVLDGAGEISALYRKIHLFDVSLEDGTSLCESQNTMPGDKPVVFEALGVKVGLSICYDLRFPELYRQLSGLGAEALLVPAAFTAYTGQYHWHILLRARAIEAQAWVIAAAQWGKHPGRRESYGHSMIVDPWGEILSESEAGEGCAVATLDRSRLLSVRRSLPSLEHRVIS